jgi:signal transduction histidine kinase
MRSIRLSLVVYFLLLLAVGLGAVSYLYYRTAARALRDKQETNRQLLRTQYSDLKREEKQKFDSELISKTSTLVSLAQSQVDQNKALPLYFSQLNVLGPANLPGGHVAMPLWLAQTYVNRLRMEIFAAQAANIMLTTEPFRRDESHSTEYFYQINSGRGRSWHSESLGEAKLPFDMDNLHRMAVLVPYFDDIVLNGQTLRRVQLKAPIMKHTDIWPTTSQFSFSGPFPRGGGSGGPPRPDRNRANPPPPSWSRETPTAHFQSARDTANLDRLLASMDEEEAGKLADQERESREALSQIRRNLLLIVLATFAAMCIGASLLIGLGLAPLRRLSEAVSQVSEKDIQLHYDGPPPPSEVEPIIERLKQTLKMLQHAFDREKRATSDISHELRTPLAAMLTTLEVSLRKARTAEEYRETLAECRDLVKQMTQLVGRLLTLTWLDARSDQLRHEAVDAGDVADQCAALVRPLARANGLKLEVHRELPVRLTTDPDKLREVIANLMHNAIEYNRPAGSVDVSVRRAGTGLDLEVSDTGIGIAAEHRDHIFERFYRADPSRQATGLHAGLGLAIVRGYVELMGGTISVESELGRGSTFRVRIPSAENGTSS